MKRKAVNLVAFNAAWFAAVGGAAEGHLWWGPAAFAAVVLVHLALVERRAAELGFLLAAGIAGTLVDAGLHAAGATGYPTSPGGWPPLGLPAWLPPPWIASLWVGFATLPRFSLAWLRGRPVAAALLGAVGGPLSYLGGARLGAVAVAADPWWTIGLLAIEYALVTPLLVQLAPGARQES